MSVMGVGTTKRHWQEVTLYAHKACGYRWWSQGRMPDAGDCPSCGAANPTWICIPAITCFIDAEYLDKNEAA